MTAKTRELTVSVNLRVEEIQAIEYVLGDTLRNPGSYSSFALTEKERKSARRLSERLSVTPGMSGTADYGDNDLGYAPDEETDPYTLYPLTLTREQGTVLAEVVAHELYTFPTTPVAQALVRVPELLSWLDLVFLVAEADRSE